MEWNSKGEGSSSENVILVCSLLMPFAKLQYSTHGCGRTPKAKFQTYQNSQIIDMGKVSISYLHFGMVFRVVIAISTLGSLLIAYVNDDEFSQKAQGMSCHTP